MHEELLQFKLQDVWTLVDLPYRKRAIGSKWVFKNKLDERGIVKRNKARLVAQGYTQEECINYDEVFAPVARIEAIRLFLAYASFKDFVVYQMDVKSAFLYGKIKEEVYIFQPPRIEDPDFLTKFTKGNIDKTLFIRRHKGDILLVQVYVDDIIFGLTKKELCISFEKLMHDKFQTSSIGELSFFLRLQVKQKKEGIVISQDTYVDEILKKFRFFEVKTASTPMETQNPLLKDKNGEEVDVYIYRSIIGSLMYLTSSRPEIMFVVRACARYQVNPKVSHLHAVKRIFRYLKGQHKLGLWYPKDSPLDLMAYTDSDYAGASLDRKSTIGGYQFLRCRLISWQCKKQTVVANSSTEAEYVVASSYCGQVLLIQNQLLDYGQPKRKTTKVPQPSESTDIIADEAVYKEEVTVWKNLMGQVPKELVQVMVPTAKTPWGIPLLILERRVKKLEKNQRSRTHKLKILYKVGLAASIISSSDDKALDKEDTSKHGRIDEIDTDEDITLVSTHDDVSTQDNIVQDEGIEDVVSAAERIVTTAPTIIAESTKTNVEVTQAPKRKGVMIQEPEETTKTKKTSS
nr:putative ribonuclease H-like domain-containing protein [Tanacetum cinerariifolium]